MTVTPFSSLKRYCTLLTTGYDMNSGPLNSSSVGRLIACTMPQQCLERGFERRVHPDLLLDVECEIFQCGFGCDHDSFSFFPCLLCCFVKSFSNSFFSARSLMRFSWCVHSFSKVLVHSCNGRIASGLVR